MLRYIDLNDVVYMHTGALIYLLHLYCNSTNATAREKTAELFAKLLADKLHGPKIRILLSKFLPPVFMDAMRDSAEASVHMFESKSPTVFSRTYCPVFETRG